MSLLFDSFLKNINFDIFQKYYIDNFNCVLLSGTIIGFISSCAFIADNEASLETKRYLFLKNNNVKYDETSQNYDLSTLNDDKIIEFQKLTTTYNQNLITISNGIFSGQMFFILWPITMPGVLFNFLYDVRKIVYGSSK